MKTRTRQIILGIILTLSLIFLIHYTGQTEPFRLEAVQAAQQAQAIETGAVLYSEHCRDCHGLRGEGMGELGPALNDEYFFTGRLTDVDWPGTLAEYISLTTAGGRLTATRPLYAGDGTAAVMPAWSQTYGGPLRPDQIKALTAFILNWQSMATGQIELPMPAAPPSYPADPEAQARGQKLFISLGCADCHSIEGISHANAGPALNHIGQIAGERKPLLSAAAYLRESILIPNAYFVAGFEPDTVEQSCGAVAGLSQLDDVVTFLLAQK